MGMIIWNVADTEACGQWFWVTNQEITKLTEALDRQCA